MPKAQLTSEPLSPTSTMSTRINLHITAVVAPWLAECQATATTATSDPCRGATPMVPAICLNRTPDINHKVATAVVMAHRAAPISGYRHGSLQKWSSGIPDVVIDNGHFSHPCTQAAFDVRHFHCLLHMYYNDFHDDTTYPRMHVAFSKKA